jgi:hypothetical protein
VKSDIDESRLATDFSQLYMDFGLTSLSRVSEKFIFVQSPSFDHDQMPIKEMIQTENRFSLNHLHSIPLTLNFSDEEEVLSSKSAFMPPTLLFPNVQVQSQTLTMVSIFKAVLSLSMVSLKESILRNEDLSNFSERDLALKSM